MANASGGDSDSDDIRSASYLALFRRHVQDFQNHLAGKDELGGISSSFVPPAGFWTPEEKDIFFHGLSVHSALRPDLIALALPMKTAADVSAYIDMLDVAAAETGTSVPRQDFEIAVETSENWINIENIEGAKLNAVEWEWDMEQKRQAYDTAIANERDLLENGGPTEPTMMARFDEWVEQCTRLWDREFALALLGDRQLRQLEAIFDRCSARSVDPHIDGNTPGISDVWDPNPLTWRPEELKRARLAAKHRNAPKLSLPPPPTAKSFEGDILKAQQPPIPIDPMLLENTGPSSSTVPIPQAVSRIPEEDEDSGNMSPRSRRRLQKRLHMRRRRAEKDGVQASTTSKKLRPGRRPKGGPPPQSTQCEAAEDHRATRKKGLTDIDVALVDTEAEATPWSAERMAFLHTVMQEQNLDVRALAEIDLDLFNLSAIGKLMSFYGLAWDDNASSTQTTIGISADVLRLFRKILSEFVAELMHGAIVCREQENALKRNNKVWRQAKADKEFVTTTHVERAVEHLGLEKRTKDALLGAYFNDELVPVRESRRNEASNVDNSASGDGEQNREEDNNARGSKKAEENAREDNSSDDDERDEDDEDEDEDTVGRMLQADDQEGFFDDPALHWYSLHQDINTPLVRLPPHLHYSNAISDGSPDDENEMEVDEEDALDAQDMLLEAEQEQDLWKMMDISRSS
ncbi:hypothetical protein CYLTODRAFT_485756 [Cylindrobasidium torrendii FP15055 ss-10]|uniref:Uncharacterized protein n=1 Tax=Cylindrobasidium torrendii FP15055 ss-10 TaxID=1314674 RepID=A0A0D7BS02_9AGAR|nr:hypothetical protein CYLTODRAFT_485756 [Cylindrobasidium torrendii FP15055 ss-10]